MCTLTYHVLTVCKIWYIKLPLKTDRAKTICLFLKMGGGGGEHYDMPIKPKLRVNPESKSCEPQNLIDLEDVFRKAEDAYSTSVLLTQAQKA